MSLKIGQEQTRVRSRLCKDKVSKIDLRQNIGPWPYDRCRGTVPKGSPHANGLRRLNLQVIGMQFVTDKGF